MQYFELCNPNSFAVDVTGWSVQGSVTWPANPGAVIPSSRCVYVARHIPAFKARQSSPKVRATARDGSGPPASPWPTQASLPARREERAW